MPTSRTFRGVAAGIAESFISRNNDLGGYWGIGMLLRSVKSRKCQTIRLDLISGQLDPNLRGFGPLSTTYRELLMSQLSALHMPSGHIRTATLSVTFDSDHPRENLARASWRCVCRIEIQDWHGKNHVAERQTWCEPHSMLRERRSTRRKTVPTKPSMLSARSAPQHDG